MQTKDYNPTPGIGTERTYQHRRVLHTDGGKVLLPHAGAIDGAQSRDPGNTPVTVLRAGNVMGRITSSGLWAPAFVGALASAYTSGGTTLTVTAAQATELARLVGQSGTNKLVAIGAPTATGTVAVTAFTHSAIDTSTGAITVTSLGVNKHAGTIIAVNDGRYTPLGLLGEGYGVKVVDEDGTSLTTARLGELIVGGFIDTAQVPLYPAAANTSLQAWIKSTIKGNYFWTDDYGV